MNTQLLGSIYALLTALAWAVGVMFFKRSGERWSPLALNYFKSAVALLIFFVTLLFVEGARPPQLSARETLFLLASGAAGIGVADSLFFHCLNTLGAARAAVVDTVYAPSVVLVAFFLLGERLSAADAVGAVLVAAGVLLVTLTASYGRRELEATGVVTSGAAAARARIVEGAASGVLGIVIMAVAIVAVKPLIERLPVLWSTTVRLTGGVALLTVLGLSRAALRREMLATFRPQRVWRHALPAAVVGTYFSLMLWIAGFKYASASVAAILNQTSTIFIVVLAAIFLGERMSWSQTAAVVLTFVGSTLVMW